MKKFKFMCICLSMSILLTGCSSSDSSAKVEVNENLETNVVNKYGWLVPAEPLVFSAGYGQGNPNEQEEYTQRSVDWFADEFNVHIDPYWWETDYTERQSLMMASGDYKDVMSRLSIDQVQNWINADLAIDLLPLIREHVPELEEYMGHYFNRYITDDGKMYSLPDMWGYWEAPQVAPTIRMDWWEELGSPEITNPQSYYEVLKLIIEKHPTDAQGNKVYALGMTEDVGSYISQYGGMYGLYGGWKIEDNTLTHWSQTQEGLDLVLWLNQIHRDGLLDPDSFTQTFEQLKSKFANERYAGYLGAWWHAWHLAHEQWQLLDDTWKENERLLHINVVADGIENSTYSSVNSMGYYRTIITKQAEDKAVDILKWFAYQMTDDGMRVLGWGAPDEGDWKYSGWSMNEAGEYEMNPEYVKRRIANIDFPFTEQYNNGAMQLNNTIKLMYDDQSLSAYWDVNFRDQDPWFDIMYENLEGTYYDGAYLSSVVIPASHDLSTVKVQISDTASTGFAAAVMASTEEECRQIFEKMASDVKDLGVEEYQAYYTKEYQENLKNWGE